MLAVSVHIGHFPARFIAKEGASGLLAAFRDAGDHLRGLVPSNTGRKIVEEQQRTRALNQNIIGTHSHKIDTDRIMLCRKRSQLHLGADPIGGSNQHRFGHSGHIRLEKAAEPPISEKDPVDMGLYY